MLRKTFQNKQIPLRMKSSSLESALHVSRTANCSLKYSATERDFSDLSDPDK